MFCIDPDMRDELVVFFTSKIDEIEDSFIPEEYEYTKAEKQQIEGTIETLSNIRMILARVPSCTNDPLPIKDILIKRDIPKSHRLQEPIYPLPVSRDLTSSVHKETVARDRYERRKINREW